MPVFQVTSLNIPSINLSVSPQNSRRQSVIVALSRQSSIISNVSRKVSLTSPTSNVLVFVKQTLLNVCLHSTRSDGMKPSLTEPDNFANIDEHYT